MLRLPSLTAAALVAAFVLLLFNMLHGDGHQDADAIETRLSRPQVAAKWALTDEDRKNGSGLLFFAYGGTQQVDAFLHEATLAARSFRVLNPDLQIAIVTNNATVDRSVFTHHIVPRADLLFQGSDCPDVCRPDHMARQWTTRIYYMALSPFEITWALDSNVFACPGSFAPNAIHSFLRTAERTALWGYDIAHANSNSGQTMFPHCFDMMWRWNERTSNVFRDWLMLMLRRGVATNDQLPLRIAEARLVAATHGRGLAVGQVPTEFAAAMYSATTRSFWPRISRELRGPAYLVHGSPVVKKGQDSGPELCMRFNDALPGTRRQLFKHDVRTKATLLPDVSACTAALGGQWATICPFRDGAAPEDVRHGLLSARLIALRDVKWTF